MPAYIVTYDLHTPGQKYKCLSEKLEEDYYRSWRIQDSVWIIETSKSATQVLDKLQRCLDDNDKLLVAELTDEADWDAHPAKDLERLNDILD